MGRQSRAPETCRRRSARRSRSRQEPLRQDACHRLQQYGLGRSCSSAPTTRGAGAGTSATFITPPLGPNLPARLYPALLGGSKAHQLTTDRQIYLSGDRVPLRAPLQRGFDPVRNRLSPPLRHQRRQSPQQQVTLRPVPEHPACTAPIHRRAPATIVLVDGSEHLSSTSPSPTQVRARRDRHERTAPPRDHAMTARCLLPRRRSAQLPDTISQRTEKSVHPGSRTLVLPLILSFLSVVTAEWAPQSLPQVAPRRRA